MLSDSAANGNRNGQFKMRCSSRRVVPATKGHLRWRTMADRLPTPSYPATSLPLLPLHPLIACVCVALIFIIYLLCMERPGSVDWQKPFACQHVHDRWGRGRVPARQRPLCRWPTNLSQSQSFWRHISRALNMHRNHSVHVERMLYATHQIPCNSIKNKIKIKKSRQHNWV